MNKKLIIILLAILMALFLIYIVAFSPLSVTGNAIIENCQNPNDLDKYDCQLFEEEITNLCGSEFYETECQKYSE